MKIFEGVSKQGGGGEKYKPKFGLAFVFQVLAWSKRNLSIVFGFTFV